MPQVKSKFITGWYKNVAVDTSGSPAPLVLGAMFSFAPGQSRHLDGPVVCQSRATYAAAEAALANGSLVRDEDEPGKSTTLVDETASVDGVDAMAGEGSSDDEAATGDGVAADVVPGADEIVPDDGVAGGGVEAFSKSELKAMDKVRLVEMARDLGLDDGGTKNSLIHRIISAQVD